jgi:spermidine synthase
MPTATVSSASDRVLLSGIALSSFAALLLELALTRLFSVVLFYHFAFLVISIALLGLGAGGVFAYMWKARLALLPTRSLAAWLCVANAAVVPLVLETVLYTPVSLTFSRSNVLRLTLIYLASAFPFFLTGLQLSIVFARQPDRIPRLYSADLVGGAMACLGIVPLLNLLGAPSTILVAACAASFAATAWAPERPLRRLSGAVAGALALLIVVNYKSQSIDIVYAKGRLVDRSATEFARWNAISRVEVDRTEDGKLIIIDSDAATSLMDVELQNWKGSKWERKLMSSPPAIANVLRPHGDFAIIGPGGGMDVVRAVAEGSPNVTGIEINPTITKTIMRGKYADYSHHLYENSQVHIHTTDGRTYLRNTKERFDVIQMTLVDTWASTSAGAFALSENNLYTVEAFQEYFDHLRPDGLIAVTRWEFRHPREALRVVSVAMEALHRLGVDDTSKHFMVVSEGDLSTDGVYVLVLAKKCAFTAAEESAAKAHVAAYPGLVFQYLPSQPRENPFSSLIAGNAPRAFAAQYLYNVSPVTDDAPFFFFTLKPGQIWRLLGHHGGEYKGIDWKVNVGVAVLGIVLAISVIAVLAFLIVPLAARIGVAHRQSASLLYFVAVGLGYILTEIAFIQRFVLFLGHPTYSLTVVVFLLLLSSGLGSLVSRRRLPDTSRVWIPLILIVATLLLNVLGLPALLRALVGLPFPIKTLVSAVLLIPLGFVMGMPFPSGLRALASRAGCSTGENAIEWAWAMNAASSVLGSVLAIIIAIQYGLTITLACGALAYLIASLLTRTLRRPLAAEAL